MLPLQVKFPGLRYGVPAATWGTPAARKRRGAIIASGELSGQGVYISPDLLKINQLVGQGSFGEVFEVRLRQLNRPPCLVLNTNCRCVRAPCAYDQAFLRRGSSSKMQVTASVSS
jgi:hypothetical protein